MRLAVKGEGHFKPNPDGSTTQEGQSKEWIAFENRWGHILGDDFHQAVSDLKANRVTDNVRMMLFNDLSRIQPISLSEMPKFYLDHPNMRLAYMLKSFTIKQLDFVYKGSIDEMKAGNYKEGFKNLVMFMLIFPTANMGIDLLKKMILGQAIGVDEIKDEWIDNLLKLIGFNKYMVGNVVTDGPIDAAVQFAMPPTQWAADIGGDARRWYMAKEGEWTIDDLRFYRNIPVVGRFAYYRWGHGSRVDMKAAKKRRTKRRNTARDEAILAFGNGEINSARSIVDQYEAERPEDMRRLTFKSIRTAVQRQREEEEKKIELGQGFFNPYAVENQKKKDFAEKNAR